MIVNLHWRVPSLNVPCVTSRNVKVPIDLPYTHTRVLAVTHTCEAYRQALNTLRVVSASVLKACL
jgi:hypothetical protein